MINLIPPEGHKAVRKEYMLRVGATFGFLLGSILILLAVAHIPRYVLVNAQIQTFALEEGKMEEEKDSYARLASEARLTQDILAQLKTSAEALQPSAVIEEIYSFESETIDFNKLILKEEGGKIKQVHIQGRAARRESLAALKSAMEESSLFESVHVPISDLARDADLPFAIIVLLDTEK